MSDLQSIDSNTYFIDDKFIRCCQDDIEVWKVDTDKIRILTLYSGMNGGNDTDIVVLIDLEGNRYIIDFTSISNHQEVVEWLDNKYGFADAEVELDKCPRIFYPKELFGLKAFNNSIKTWLIRNVISAGDGILSKEIKNYLANQRC